MAVFTLYSKKMFTWVVKVVPQPPEPVKRLETAPEVKGDPPHTQGPLEQKPLNVEIKEQSSAPKDETDTKPTAEQTQPTPAEEPEPKRETSSGRGVLGWLKHNLGKVIPHHVGSPTQTIAAVITEKQDTEQPTKEETKEEIKAPDPPPTPTLAPSPPEPLPHPAPAPEPAQPSQPPTEPSPAEEAPSLVADKEKHVSVLLSCAGGKKRFEKGAVFCRGGRGGGIFSWIVQSLGKVIPQPEGTVKSPKPLLRQLTSLLPPRRHRRNLNHRKKSLQLKRRRMCLAPASIAICCGKLLSQPEPEPEPVAEEKVTVVTVAVEEATDDKAAPPTETLPTVKTIEVPRSPSTGGISVLGWLKQGLEKVVPHPVEISVPVSAVVQVESAPSEQKEPEPQEEEPPTEKKPEPEPEPVAEVKVTVVTVAVEEATDGKAAPPTETSPTVKTIDVPRSPSTGGISVLGWLKHGLEKVVPQPVEISVPGSAIAQVESAPSEQEVKLVEEPKVEEEETDEEETQTVTVIEVTVIAPTPDPIVKEEKEPDTKTSVFSWFVEGLGKVVPQPVTKSQQTTQEKLQDDRDVTTSPVEEIHILPREEELVLEDLEDGHSDWDDNVPHQDAATQTSECEVVDQATSPDFGTEVTRVVQREEMVEDKAEKQLWHILEDQEVDAELAKVCGEAENSEDSACAELKVCEETKSSEDLPSVDDLPVVCSEESAVQRRLPLRAQRQAKRAETPAIPAFKHRKKRLQRLMLTKKCALELPNVPSYRPPTARLPPISRRKQRFGVTNPNFLAEEWSPSHCIDNDPSFSGLST
ncbi:proteoglycan 4-like [Callorhinchus milii]|uniref:proteoglycan 4-like n=1 Tax=Callorhinchus milii TaxID=7868 RepID=UPI001C3FEBF7|nr:proteoglycan 4-like [Callorhinchus milii]